MLARFGCDGKLREMTNFSEGKFGENSLTSDIGLAKWVLEYACGRIFILIEIYQKIPLEFEFEFEFHFLSVFHRTILKNVCRNYCIF